MSPAPVAKRKTSKFKRAVWKGSFHVLRLSLLFASYFSHRLYMRGYARVLAAWGMKLRGEPRYIAPDCYFDNLALITLGERVVLSTNVQFLTHDYSVTTALIAAGAAPATDVASERPIEIGSNVFIGRNTLVMPGTVVGNNVIVGAGSVVRGSIPDDSIVMGNPAVRIGSLKGHADQILQNVQRWDSFRAD